MLKIYGGRYFSKIRSKYKFYFLTILENNPPLQHGSLSFDFYTFDHRTLSKEHIISECISKASLPQS